MVQRGLTGSLTTPLRAVTFPAGQATLADERHSQLPRPVETGQGWYCGVVAEVTCRESNVAGATAQITAKKCLKPKHIALAPRAVL